MIKANRPDIVIKDKQEKSCLLIDMSIPTEKNTSVKVTEKLSKSGVTSSELQKIALLGTSRILRKTLSIK